MPSNYSKLKTTYSSEPILGDTPPNWWGIIGSNKDQATLVNPGSAHSTSGTCKDFAPSSWTADLNVEQPKIQYYYDKNSNPGTLTCKTTQSGDIRTATITCSGNKCCSGTGLNGLIPEGLTFPGMVRPGDTSKPQCIANVDPSKTMGFKCDITKRTCKNPKGCPDNSNCVIGEPDCTTTTQSTCKDLSSCDKCFDGGDGQGSYSGIEEDCTCDGHGGCTLKGTKCCNGCYSGFVPGPSGGQYMKFCRPCSWPPPTPACIGKSTVACPDWLPEGDPNKDPNSDYWNANRNLSWGGGLNQYCQMDQNFGSKSWAITGDWHDCGQHGGNWYTASVGSCCANPP